MGNFQAIEHGNSNPVNSMDFMNVQWLQTLKNINCPLSSIIYWSSKKLSIASVLALWKRNMVSLQVKQEFNDLPMPIMLASSQSEISGTLALILLLIDYCSSNFGMVQNTNVKSYNLWLLVNLQSTRAT